MIEATQLRAGGCMSSATLSYGSPVIAPMLQRRVSEVTLPAGVSCHNQQ